MTQPIVVIGAGYGGLTAARALGSALRHDHEHPVILVDAHDYHELKPKLPEALGASIDCDVQVPVRAVLDTDSVAFVQSAVTGVDPQAHVVQTEAGPLPYWRLVWALGGEPDFAPAGIPIPGVAETAIAPYSRGQACRLRHHLRTLVEQAAAATSAEDRCSMLTILVAGGGFVGVEVAGELADRLVDLT